MAWLTFVRSSSISMFVCLLPALTFAQLTDTDSEFEFEFFEKQVRPILVESCGQCHGREADPAEGGLYLTSRASILTGGDTGPAIVPGEPENSLLVDAIQYRGVYQMPPDTKLPAEKIQVLTEWVSRGAPWPDNESAIQSKTVNFDLEQRRHEHWAWHPARPVALPPVIDQSWVLDPLDQFVLAKLEEQGLSPAADADRRNWIRRVYFDLIGLPPSPEAVQRFVADQDWNAFEKVVDELLASSHFGEHWARHWMDLVRYAETYGHEFDYEIAHAYQYRDYLIRAFNADVPYDQFIREHFAGDLLPQPRRSLEHDYDESILGTGFWFLGEATHGPVDVRGDEAGRIDNQIDVASKTFLGMTVACARCHDHKFDAISAEDYYALVGFLQSSRRQTVLLDPGRVIEHEHRQVIQEVEQSNQRLTAWFHELEQLSADQWSQVLMVPMGSSTEPPEKEIPEGVMGAAQQNLTLPAIRFLEWIESDPANLAVSPLEVFSLLAIDDTVALRSRLDEIKLRHQQQTSQRQLFLDQAKLIEDFSLGIPEDWFRTGWAFEPSRPPFSFSLEGSLMVHRGLASSGIWGGRFQGVLRSPTFELSHDELLIRARGMSTRIRLIVDGYEMDIHNALLFIGCQLDLTLPDRFEWVRLSGDVQNYRGHRAYLEFIDHEDTYMQIDEIWAVDKDAPAPVDEPSRFLSFILDDQPADREQLIRSMGRALERLFSQPDSTPDDERCQIISALLERSYLGDELFQRRQEIQERLTDLPSPLMAIAMADGTGEDESLFIRGNSKTLGAKVPRRFLTALSTSSESSFATVHGSRRLDLADKIASSDNPLTSRVMVNRLWRYLIGRGIVPSVDNFGVMGSPPTHPELLDFLAQEFVAADWSIKQIIRRVSLSRTYRVSSSVEGVGERLDPENIWLHRAHIKRLPGEAIRDAMLWVSGSLDETMYGPGVPIYLTAFMQGRGRPRGSGPLDGHGRRSIYIQVRRNFLSPMMLTFDAPIPFNTIGDRHESNVPAQALTLMNDPLVIELAGRWAKRILEQPLTWEQRVRKVFLQALSRPETDEELQAAREFFELQRQTMGQAKDESENQHQLWQDFCHVVFNMKEFIFVQ